MPASGVVPGLDPGEYGQPCFSFVFPGAPIDQFTFKGSKKALSHCVIIGIAHTPTWAGFLYLAVVIDVFSRKVVGWSFAENMTASLVISALNMALITRKPGKVIHHSDQGNQYTSVEFGKRCKEMGVCPSMGSVGDAYDNAMAESFFASLECELINRRSWQNKTAAKTSMGSPISLPLSIG